MVYFFAGGFKRQPKSCRFFVCLTLFLRLISTIKSNGTQPKIASLPYNQAKARFHSKLPTVFRRPLL